MPPTSSLSELNLFIIAGMPRSGTTFLYHNLQKHPSVFIPYRKEIEYYSFNYEKNNDWYFDYYKDKKKEVFSGDISPIYFFSEDAINRIQNDLPNVKIIIMLRDPIEFSVSWHNHVSTFLYKIPDFENFIQNFTISKGKTSIHLDLSSGIITEMIKKYSEAFGENVLFCNYNLLKTNSLQLLKTIEDFIGLPQYFNEKNYDNLIINPKKNYNYKLIYSILNNEKIIPILTKLIGRNTIRRIRNKEVLQSAKIISKNKFEENTNNKYIIAEKYFKKESEYINNLFSGSLSIKGTNSKINTF